MFWIWRKKNLVNQTFFFKDQFFLNNSKYWNLNTTQRTKIVQKWIHYISTKFGQNWLRIVIVIFYRSICRPTWSAFFLFLFFISIFAYIWIYNIIICLKYIFRARALVTSFLCYSRNGFLNFLKNCFFPELLPFFYISLWFLCNFEE